MNTETILIPKFDGKEIMEGLKFRSAVRVEDGIDNITWLVETLSGDKIIIVAKLKQSPLHPPYTHYMTHYGRAVEKYAAKHSLSQSNAHHLLTQLV